MLRINPRGGGGRKGGTQAQGNLGFPLKKNGRQSSPTKKQKGLSTEKKMLKRNSSRRAKGAKSQEKKRNITTAGKQRGGSPGEH